MFRRHRSPSHMAAVTAFAATALLALTPASVRSQTTADPSLAHLEEEIARLAGADARHRRRGRHPP